MSGKVFRLLITCLLILNLCELSAQELGNSPYSQIGIGDVWNPGFTHQASMGGTGVSYTLPFLINNLNPALLSHNRRVVLDVGAVSQLKEVAEGERTQRDFGASLAHIGLAFPITPRLSAGVVLSPYSNVSYENNFTENVINATPDGLTPGDFTADVLYRGSGGLSTLSLGAGMEILGKKSYRPDTLDHRLSVGLKASYLFGAIRDEIITQLNEGGSQQSFNIDFFDRTTYSGLLLEPGIAYSYRFGSDSRVNLGFTYTIRSNPSVERFNTIIRTLFAPSTPEDDPNADTLFTEVETEVFIPSRLKFGISYEKLDERSLTAIWAVSADVAYQDWSQYDDIRSQDTLVRQISAAVGVQFIPDFTSVRRGFWRRTAYRAGFRYERGPLDFEGQTIDDISVSAGFSIPFGRSSSLLNLTVVAGQRGTLDQNLLKDRYVQFRLGLTINDTWFIRPKYD